MPGPNMLHTARDDCERLQGIVEELLDLSRIQAGKIELALAPIPAKSIVDAAVAARQSAAGDLGVTIETTLGEPILPVLADADRIELGVRQPEWKRHSTQPSWRPHRRPCRAGW